MRIIYRLITITMFYLSLHQYPPSTPPDNNPLQPKAHQNVALSVLLPALNIIERRK
jgi:hypothetical protein